MFVELSSHAVLENQNSSMTSDLTWCDVTHHIPHSADCPHNRKRRGPEGNFYGEANHHWVLIGDVTLPVSGVLYRSEFFDLSPAHPISRPQTPPFQPPKQA
ncbi:MAG: hypothetical protein ABJA02_04665 [Acidobacteriota bacterium]